MFNAIMIHIQTHLTLLEMAIYSSQKINQYARAEDLDNVSNETDNRERIISVVAQIQTKIESQIEQLTPQDLMPDSLPIIKSWFHDLTLCSEMMTALDAQTIETLAEQKEKTTQEIVTIFKSKEKFKGYNLTSKK